MLFRKAKKEIENWLDQGKDALLVTGVRQCGKKYLVKETLKERGVSYVEFNFIKTPSLKGIFRSAIDEDADKFLAELIVAARKPLKDGDVIFLDEVQEIKDVVTAIKFLVEQGRYRYILSGSLLGVELKGLRSAPVGYLTTVEMYPLDLEEFYIANGLGKDVIERIKGNFEKKEPVDDFIHNALIEAFYRYLIVGGMPEAVQKYVDTQDLNAMSRIHKKIYREYKRDFTKYEAEKKLKLIRTYDLIPSELSQKNKRYQFTDLDPELHFDRYENSFNWLIDAGVAIPVYNVTEFAIPLEASKKSNLFKLFLSDVGMLTTFYGPATQLKLLSRGKDINCGAMFENFVAEELNSHGFKCFYFNSKKHGEVDSLVEYRGNLLPIEVKSGKDYQKHSALTYFMSTDQFKSAIVLSDYNVQEKGNILYLPIYMTMFLHNGFELGKPEKIDLSILSKRG